MGKSEYLIQDTKSLAIAVQEKIKDPGSDNIIANLPPSFLAEINISTYVTEILPIVLPALLRQKVNNNEIVAVVEKVMPQLEVGLLVSLANMPTNKLEEDAQQIISQATLNYMLNPSHLNPKKDPHTCEELYRYHSFYKSIIRNIEKDNKDPVTQLLSNIIDEIYSAANKNDSNEQSAAKNIITDIYTELKQYKASNDKEKCVTTLTANVKKSIQTHIKKNEKINEDSKLKILGYTIFRGLATFVMALGPGTTVLSLFFTKPDKKHDEREDKANKFNDTLKKGEENLNKLEESYRPA